MKKTNAIIILLMFGISTFGQTLIKGKSDEFPKNSSIKFLLKSGDEVYSLFYPLLASVGKKPPAKIVKFKINNGTSIIKENETTFDINARKFFYMDDSPGNGILFANNETKNFFLGFPKEFVDNNFTIKKEYKGRFVLEKYDVGGKLINTFEVDKKKGEDKNYYFNVVASDNGKHVGFINNTEYSVYNTDNFQLEKTFKLKFSPEEDRAKFFVLSDGSLIFITLTNPVYIMRCDFKTGDVKVVKTNFKSENNFGATFKLSDDEKFLIILVANNDQKNSKGNTSTAKGIQILGLDLSNLELSDDISYTFGADLLAKMDEKSSIEFLRIDNVFKINKDYIIITDVNYTHSSSSSVRNHSKDILLIKINSNNENSFKIIERNDDIDADLFTFIVDNNPYILISSECRERTKRVFEGSGGNKKVLGYKIENDLTNKIIFKGDPYKLLGMYFNKIDARNYFVYITIDEKPKKYLPYLISLKK